MNELLNEFEQKFEKVKKDLKLKVTLKDIDELFVIKDYILKEGYVSENLIRQIARRVGDFLNSWLQYLHGWVFPNPNSIPGVTESQLFGEEEKAEITKMIDKIMYLTSKSGLASLCCENKFDKEFIEEASVIWKKDLSPKIKKIMEKINKNWDVRSKAPIEKKAKKKEDSIYG